MALAYLVAVVVLASVCNLAAERWWWTTLLLYIPQAVYLAPAVVTVPAALFGRDGRALLLNGLVLALVAGPVMGLHIPLPHPVPAADRPRLRVLEYNIEAAKGGFQQIQPEIDRFRPDVVILAEASGSGNDTTLAPALEHAFEGWHTALGGEVFVASRWPVVERRDTPLGSGAWPEQVHTRRKVDLKIRAPFGVFRVVGLHFYTAVNGRTLKNEWRKAPAYMRHTAAVRLDQARNLLEYTEQLPEPLIVAGDFNTPPAGMIYGKLTARFGDAFAERGRGWGYTFPSKHPLLRIDYIFHSPHWEATETRVGEGRGSDHRCVFAELALKSNP